MNIMKTQNNLVMFPKLAIFLLMLVFLLEGCAPQPTVETVEFRLDGNPLLTKDNLKVRCYTGNNPPQLLPDANEDHIEINPETGEVSFPADCAYVAVLYKLSSWRNDPNEPAFWVYATSWDRSLGTPNPVDSDINISTNNKLTLFNAVVSLEWQPDPDATYVTDLQDGLRNASAYLYDVTDGQMAFGDITIYSGGQNWDDADLRFLASNDRRPSAFVGGIVNTRLRFQSPNVQGNTYFSPGRILLGRYWNGKDAFSGKWNQPNAYRTIIHEWGHYALFLYDEYLHTGVNTASLDYCTCKELPEGTSCNASIMAYHYPLDKDGTPGPDDPEDTSELWHPNDTASPTNVCVDSLQGYVHGQSDWETLGDWGAIQGLLLEPLTVPSSVVPGPSIGVAGDFLGFLNHTVPNPEPNPTLHLILPTETTVAAKNLPATQAYIIKNDGQNPSTVQILHQGQMIGPTRVDGMELLGVSNSDKLWFSVDQYSAVSNTNGNRYVPKGGNASPASDPVADADPWQASLDLIYSVTSSPTGSKLTALKVVLSDTTTDPDLRSQEVQLCVPNIGGNSGFLNGCTDKTPMNFNSSHYTWEFTFTAANLDVPELPTFGFVRILGGPDGEQQLIRWYEDDGPPGPAHSGGDAPAVDGAVMVNTTKPLPVPRCSRVFVMPATDFGAVSVPLTSADPDIRGIVGIPLDVDILMPEPPSGTQVDPEADCVSPPRAVDQLLPFSITLAIPYPIPRLNLEAFAEASPSIHVASLQPVFFQDPLVILPEQLRLLHFNRSMNTWELVPASDASDLDIKLGWLAQEIQVDGIYAIGWCSAVDRCR